MKNQLMLICFWANLWSANAQETNADRLQRTAIIMDTAKVISAPSAAQRAALLIATDASFQVFSAGSEKKVAKKATTASLHLPYRQKASGAWNDASIWEIQTAQGWKAASTPPTGSEPSITLTKNIQLRKNTTVNIACELICAYEGTTISFEENAVLNLNRKGVIKHSWLRLTCTGAGKVHFNDGFNLTASDKPLHFTGAMSVIVVPNTVLNNCNFSLGGTATFTNYGSLTFVPLHPTYQSYHLTDQAKFINESSGTITGILYNLGTLAPQTVFENKGTLKTQTKGWFGFGSTGTIINSGRIEISSQPTVTYENKHEGKFINTGVLIITDGATFGKTTMDNTPEMKIIGNGTLSIGLKSVLKVAKSVEISGRLLENKGTLLTKDLLFNGTTPQIIEGEGVLGGAKVTFNNPSGVTIKGKQTLHQMFIPVNSIVNIAPNGTLQSNVGAQIYGTVNNQGAFLVQGGAIELNGFLNNKGTFESKILVTGSGKVLNEGTCLFGGYDTNTPMICQKNGSVGATGAIQLSTDCAPNGTFLTAHHQVRMQVQSTLPNLAPTGTFLLEVGGTSPYSPLTNGNYSNIHFNTNLTLSNVALQVKLSNNFVPALGNTFKIVTYKGLTAQSRFNRADLPTLPATLKWDVLYNATDITLKVVQK